MICKDAKCVESLFSDFSEKENYVNAHRSVLEGKPFQVITSSGEKTYYVSLAPRRDEKGSVSGVIGLAWDVTPNQTILDCLEKIVSLSNDDKISSARKEARKAIRSSRLHKLLKKQEESDGAE